MRKHFVHGMRQGENLCFDLDKASPNWEEYVTEGTYTNQFWDWAWMNEADNHLPYVRESENHGVGGLNPGHYARSPDFCCIIRSGADDEESLNEQIRQIPNFKTQFQHVIIE
mmetsp:Transcript_45873/g.60807  ORF Transcript_45873/g.60807 Transcript_45873/m.60807 type:complete len:112 (+) Transcript_45873:289-624(+)